LVLTFCGDFAYSQIPEFNPQADLLSLHYDHAPDRDDGHSAVADRVILQEKFGVDWLKEHALPVSGAYGENRNQFQPESDAVMNAVWNDTGGWVAADQHCEKAVRQLHKKWVNAIQDGGTVWVKEGGQSDLTADVIRKIKEENPDIDTRQKIHVVQHSDWNEDQTTDEDLAYVKEESDYIRISDANAYLNDRDGNTAFARLASAHEVYGSMWTAAFEYLDPEERVDFSDTGELHAILDMEKIDVDAFAERYFSNE
jgi:hypothetical protein